MVSVPIRTNGTTRPSRLFGSPWQFLAQSGATMLRSFAMYCPLRAFVWIGLVLLAVGAVPVLRFVYLFVVGRDSGHIQSLVIGGTLVVLGGLALMLGIIADLIAANRRLIESVLEKVRRLELRSEHRASEEQWLGSGRRATLGATEVCVNAQGDRPSPRSADICDVPRATLETMPSKDRTMETATVQGRATGR